MEQATALCAPQRMEVNGWPPAMKARQTIEDTTGASIVSPQAALRPWLAPHAHQAAHRSYRKL
jgi:hypothetical protein